MTLEQYKAVEKFEKQFTTAKYSNFARMTTVEFSELGEVYEKMFGTKITRNESTCPTCKLRIVKRVAEEYFKFKASPYYKSYLKKQEKNDEEG